MTEVVSEYDIARFQKPVMVKQIAKRFLLPPGVSVDASFLLGMIYYYLWDEMFIENETPKGLKREVRDRCKRMSQFH